ncbi:hypothetical protein HOU39_gp169 [Lactobacillus phage Iacchus]|uniref:Uncharacterized protein n=1 Tax=Lactobacillus phage Iacchus TaxID=2315483 RepID=A0A3Q8HX22_9CAUD|nr:hypothetical protein HOU39_gp169 [Lactobacillus phage Iacchus]AYH92061.1 hypothetical protein [Lactobacillus phage Iacchus]AYH92233.1 hypothetical protein [Lactobacillus phage Dionysus]
MANEEAVEVTVSQHAKSRWVERMNGITDDREIKRYLVSNSDKVTKDILTSFDNADFVFRGQLGKGHSTSDYYMLNDLVFVFEKGTIITLFKVDFGIEYEDLNETIKRSLITALQRAVDDQQEVKSKSGVETKRIKNDISQVNSEINSYRKQIDLLAIKKSGLEGQLKSVDAEVSLANTKVATLATKLLYSKDLFEGDLNHK